MLTYLWRYLQSGILSSPRTKNSVKVSCFPLQVRLCVCNSLCFNPQRLRCQRKEPCRLFTVRKRQELLDEVNTSTLCQCPHGHTCPRHHKDAGVIVGKSYTEEAIKTYSGYCISWRDTTPSTQERLNSTSRWDQELSSHRWQPLSTINGVCSSNNDDDYSNLQFK